MSKNTIAALTRGATLSAALVAGVLFAPSAIAADSAGSETDDEFSVFSVDDVGSGNAVNVCHNSVNVLGVQVADIANGLAANLPVLNDEPVSNAEGSADCNASATTVENEDGDNGHDDNGDNGDHDNGDNGDDDNGHDDNGDNGDNGHDDNGNGDGHNGGDNGNGHNGGGAGSGAVDEHANANGIAPQPVPAPAHIAVTG